jgi:hypothetical protein
VSELHETNGVANPTAGLKDLARFVVEELTRARTLDILASLIAERLNLAGMEPLIKTAALKLELEREYCRKRGMGKFLMEQLRARGVRVSASRGKLFVGPKHLIDVQTKALVTALREELLRELENERE